MSDFTQDFFTSRRNFPDGTTRIGDLDRLWYDSITNTIRISDGITPGGIIVSGGGGGLSGYSGYSGASTSGYSGYSGLSLQPWQLVTSTYYSINGNRIIADTSLAPFTLYLPSSPTVGDYVQITDGADFYTNHLIINSNGSTIEGLTDEICLDLKGVTFEFIYSGTTWQVTATTGARGQSGSAGLSGYSGLSGFSGSPAVSFTKIVQNFTELSNATGTIVHDCLNATVFNHTNLISDFTANFTNLNLTTNQILTVTLILNQGSAAYIANNIELAGTSYPVKWLDGNIPAGTINEVDFQSFTIAYYGTSYAVFGRLNSYQ